MGRKKLIKTVLCNKFRDEISYWDQKGKKKQIFATFSILHIFIYLLFRELAMLLVERLESVLQR